MMNRLFFTLLMMVLSYGQTWAQTVEEKEYDAQVLKMNCSTGEITPYENAKLESKMIFDDKGDITFFAMYSNVENSSHCLFILTKDFKQSHFLSYDHSFSEDDTALGDPKRRYVIYNESPLDHRSSLTTITFFKVENGDYLLEIESNTKDMKTGELLIAEAAFTTFNALKGVGQIIVFDRILPELTTVR